VIPQRKDKIRRKTKRLVTQEGMDINVFSCFWVGFQSMPLKGEAGREEETPLDNALNLLETCQLNGPT
jgi:hypothetical protein